MDYEEFALAVVELRVFKALSPACKAGALPTELQPLAFSNPCASIAPIMNVLVQSPATVPNYSTSTHPSPQRIQRRNPRRLEVPDVAGNDCQATLQGRGGNE